MSSPRQVLVGAVYLLTRRTTRRYFLFRPDPDREIERIFWYCLAVAAGQHGVVVHSVILMSNHLHAVITDMCGVLPSFLRDFHRTLANATKELRGWSGEVFDKSQTSCVELVTPAAVCWEMAYTIANGPRSGLVRYANDWPGARTRVSDIGRRVVCAQRPERWFDGTNDRWPAEVELPIVMPDVLLEEHGSVEAARAAIAEDVREIERQALAEAKAQGRGFMGAERVQRARITDSGGKWELFEGGKRNPTFATRGDREATRSMVKRRRLFRAEHAAALTGWRTGDREVLFPAGTWLMRVLHGARCAPPPD